ncbi:MAG TPA: LPS export ABC transporter permease LptF [Stellaceae bacterium]|nr:LPS export ABC transporter permease LptF [Stellaceae bacterium]
MTRLDRYVLRQCLGVMVFVTAALSAAIWLAQSLRLIDLIVNRGLSVEMFLYLALLILPRFLDIVLPIGVFIAVLFTFNRLAGDSELVVMRAAGLSPFALAKPVLIVAGLAFVVLMSLSAYFLPVASRDFKDLQFAIRNRFVSSLIQEGTFTSISDKLTIYARGRDDNGDITGLLINDRRDPRRPVTLLAERGAFVDTPSGPRIVMIHGNRQQYDKRTGKLSVLTFDRYTLDLDTLHDAPVVRFREPQERFLHELFFPPANVPQRFRRSFVVEGNQRLAIPLSVFGFSLIPLAFLLPGECGRRGHVKRVLAAILVGFLFEALGVSVGDLAGRYRIAIPLMYATDLLPFAVGFAILWYGGNKLGFRRPRPAGIPAADGA